MHRAFRHLLATVACVAIFSARGPLNGFLQSLQGLHNPRTGTALAVSGVLSLALVGALAIVVLAPVVSISEHLFSRRWGWPAYVQLPALVPLLFVYLVPWSLLFGSLFLTILLHGTAALILPLWVYWGIFQVSRWGGDD